MSDARRYAYKVLGPNREPYHGGNGRWAQRKRWMPTIEDCRPCQRGYHLCADEVQLLRWLGPEIWIAEYEGEPIDGGNKIVVGRARLVERVKWDERTARHFAADCAEHVVHLNSDPRVKAAIDAARSFADGEIDDAALAAAGDAALAAAWDAAGDAAWDAARAAAGDAAWAAARDAAWDAARAAAGDAAGAAAWDAAWDAAWAAARAAAWAAARAAETRWQADHLREITGGLPA